MAPTDEELMQSYQAGDALAFETLYLRLSPKLYGYLKGKLRGGPEVDDVFQQILLKLHRTRAEYDPKYRFEQWLFVIARTSLLDHFRRTQRAPTPTESREMETIPDPAEGADAKLSAERVPDLSGLSAEQRAVVEHKIFDELTYEEIARKLEKSEVSVRQLFSRAIKKLRMNRGTQT